MWIEQASWLDEGKRRIVENRRRYALLLALSAGAILYQALAVALNQVAPHK